MLTIDGQVVGTKSQDFGPPILRLGFRPFFLAASIFAVIAMAIWMASYVFAIEFSFAGMSPAIWHAHEMIFGYVMAVIAGFLLTAIKNWTGEEVLRGRALAFLFAFWLIARILPFSGQMVPMTVIAFVDVGFLFLLSAACLRPVLKVKQYKQVGIIAKLFLLMLCNLAFYLGVSGVLENGIQWGLYSALYMVIALILVMMRRVAPMFIKNGVDGEVTIKNHAWIDMASLVLLLVLWISDVFTGYDEFTAIVAAVLSVLHLVRLIGWYTHKIWAKPLVWVLLVAYVFIILGFALITASYYLGVSPFLSIHAFTVGGIGLITLGMMSRVSLGHTGRNVFEPPASVFWIVTTLLLAAVVRTLFPLFNVEYYVHWIAVSQMLWIIAFLIFVLVYAPMFLTARIDGRDG